VENEVAGSQNFDYFRWLFPKENSARERAKSRQKSHTANCGKARAPAAAAPRRGKYFMLHRGMHQICA
jgi:hypothetical protein